MWAADLLLAASDLSSFVVSSQSQECLGGMLPLLLLLLLLLSLRKPSWCCMISEHCKETAVRH
jgi:hypothetical protein